MSYLKSIQINENKARHESHKSHVKSTRTKHAMDCLTLPAGGRENHTPSSKDQRSSGDVYARISPSPCSRLLAESSPFKLLCAVEKSQEASEIGEKQANT